MRRYPWWLLAGLGVALSALAGCQSQEAGDTSSAEIGQYKSFNVKDPQQSAAFMAVEDLDGDGYKEIILSTLLELTPPGPPGIYSRGALRVFRTSEGLDGPWQEEVLISTTDVEGYPFINTPQVFDIDGDGMLDILVQTGFLTTLGGGAVLAERPGFFTTL